MATLSDLQVASLLEEMGYAMREGIPVIDSMQRISTRRLGGVSRAARTIAQRLERGESVADAVDSVGSGIGPQAASAIRTAEASGNYRLLDRIAARLRQRSNLTRESRLAWFYPWLLLLVGYAVAVWVMAPLVRQMHGRDFQWSHWLVELAGWLQLNWWLPPVVIAVLLVALLVWQSQRNRFPRQVRLSLFCNALADQMTCDVPEDVAIRAAAELSGDPELMSINAPSLKSPAVARLLVSANPQLEAAIGVSEKQSLIARLRYMATIHSEHARQLGYVWSRLVPRCAMVVVGAGLTLSYAWFVIAPVYRQVAQW